VAEALVAGLLAGYAIAIPIGPITILIFETGLRQGFRPAAAGALGAASADGLYATAAGLFGAALATILEPVITPARLVGAALLAVIGLRGLLGLRSRTDASRELPRNASGRTYLLVLGLTITNPMTFLYFSALTLGLPAVGGGLAEKLVFAAGAFTASVSWQLFLAGSGALLHGRLPAWAQLTSRLIGSLVILGFAARIGAEALAR
jgi:threonine/homoserine/homoserine lactone efflux protein